MEQKINVKIITDYISANCLTKKKFCKKCNISVSTLYSILKEKNVDVLSVFKIAKAINVPLYLFFKI